ncbi:unnamed protein product [Paramecium octaurelia]|uniref:Uncharacterized protein n=1 Tax=Paramecium octaurelia TaxID=43137 RepID=A0A8S1U4S7_PAROT|nr:unnamed protein product [Paramecium octaurelia]
MHTLPAIPVPLYKIIFFLQPLKYLFGDQLPLLQESMFPWFSDRLKTELNTEGDELWKKVFNTFKGPIIYYCIIVQITVAIKISVSYLLKVTLQSMDSWNAFLLGVLLLGQVIFEQHYFQNIYQMSAKIRASLAQMLLAKLQRISTSRLKDGQFFNIITMDIADLDLTWLIAFSGAPIIFCVGIYILFSYFGISSLVGVITLCSLMVFQKHITTKTGPLKSEKSKIQDERTKLTEEILNNLPKIKMLGLESIFRDKLLLKRQEQDNKMREILKIDALAYCFNGNINVFASLFLMMFTSKIIIGDYPSPDQIFSSIWILQLFKVWCITYGQRAYKLIINLRVLQQRINDVICIPEIEPKLLNTRQATKKQKKYQQIEEEEAASLDTVEEQRQGQIEIINYSAYWTKLQEMQNQPILNKINLKLDKGTFIIIRGAVGSGKSSLLQALLHEIPFFSGQLKIQGHVAYVEQRPYIFSGTVSENILFGCPNNETHYQNVLAQSGLSGDNIDPGFNVGENGSKLSGGQRTRLSFSRALYSDSDIYLLDDILSAVDANVQTTILNTLRYLKSQGKIVILISSRIAECDMIYKMQDGQLVQEEINMNEIQLLQQVQEQPEQQQGIQEEDEILEVSRTVYQKYIDEGGKNRAMLILFLYLFDASLSLLIIKQFGESNLLINLFLMMVYILVSFTKFNEMFGFTITVINNLHRKLISTIVRMKLENYTNIGKLMSRFTSDINNIEGMVMLDLHWVIEGLIDNIFVILVISLNSYIIIVSSAFLILMLFMKSKFHQKMKYSLNLDDQSRAQLYQSLRSSINGSILIRVYNQQLRVQNEFLQQTYSNMQAQFTFLRLNALLAFIIEFSLHILIITVLAILLQSEYSKDVIGFSVLMLMQLGYMFSLNLRGQIFLDIDMQNCVRVQNTIQLPSENYSGSKMNQWPTNGVVEFQNVYLRYPKSTKYSLQNISFKIEQGQSVGIMGRTGAGKSSIINLLLRTVDVTSGNINIDGININQINLSQLRSTVMVIPQSSNLFNQTIRFNLDPHKTCYDEQIWDALSKVKLDSVIKQWGLDSMDYNLSVGQQQLLALARAFLHDAKILIFDEATANIDDETEEVIEQALRNITATKIIIAHRPKIVVNCNYIIHMQEGQIVSQQ